MSLALFQVVASKTGGCTISEEHDNSTCASTGLSAMMTDSIADVCHEHSVCLPRSQDVKTYHSGFSEAKAPFHS